MEKPNLIYGLLILLIFLIMGIFMIEDNHEITYLVIISVTGVLFTVLKSSIGFIILISEIITTGFFLTYDAYQAKLTSIDQLPLVFNHLIFTAIVTVLWMVFFLLKRDANRFSQMKMKLAKLQRFEKQSNVLTKSEFMEKAKVVWTGLKRRNERGLLIFVSIGSSIQYTENALTKTIGNTLLATVRGDFDLVGKYDTNTYIVLLQNADEKGKELVLTRFRSLLENQVNLSIQLFTVSEKEINDGFFEAELYSGEAK